MVSRIRRSILALTLGTICLLLMALLFALPVRADNVTVSNTNDSGPGSLRQAIADASNGDTILFASILNGQTITLTNGELLITQELTIIGPGVNLLAISANNLSRIFEISPTATITISGVTIQDGSSSFGGGIYNFGALILLDSTVVSSTGTTNGGGIYNFGGSVTLANSTVGSNTASNAGGGIFNQDGSVTLTNSTVASNTAATGSGVYNIGTLTLSNSTVASNTATTDGGGILNDGGSVTLANSTVAGNTAATGGGIYNFLVGGSVTLTNGTVTANTATNQGGGIHNQEGSVTLTNSTVAGNTAPFGGGVRNNGGSVTLSNSTVAANSATNQGGGIYNFGTFALTNGTVAGNTAVTGGGIFNVVASSVVTLTNSIVADSLNGNDCSSTGTIASQGYNLDSDNTCNLTATSDITNTNPFLGPLQANGGATLTRALLVGSPAIDHIPNGANGCGATIASDQRGVVRPQGPGCDIGAFELIPNSAPIANPQTVTTSVDTAKAITLTGSDADNDVLTYTITTNPISGTLSGTAPNVTYTPNAGFRGSDSFTFRVNDGEVDSDAAVVTILVGEQGGSNRPPIANPQTVTTSVDTAKAITLTGSDADNDVLTYTIITNPISGTLSGTAPNVTYTPNAGFRGSDSFTFRVNDGEVDSDAAVVSIIVEGGTIFLPMISRQ